MKRHSERTAIEAVKVVVRHRSVCCETNSTGAVSDSCHDEATREALAWCALHARAAFAAEAELIDELVAKDKEVQSRDVMLLGVGEWGGGGVAGGSNINNFVLSEEML